jgi:hypothetical protein
MGVFIMDNDIDNALEEAGLNDKGGFEGEVWLSTDGKHTVHTKAETSDGRKNAWIWQKKVYQYLLENYGTKQAQAVKEYNKEEDLGVCKDCGAKNLRSQKGKVYCGNKCWLKNT